MKILFPELHNELIHLHAIMHASLYSSQHVYFPSSYNKHHISHCLQLIKCCLTLLQGLKIMEGLQQFLRVQEMLQGLQTNNYLQYDGCGRVSCLIGLSWTFQSILILTFIMVAGSLMLCLSFLKVLYCTLQF